MSKIQLGDKVKDTVTGFTGIAVGRTEWIAGCSRITIQPECKKGKEMDLEDNQTFDEPLLKIIRKKKVEKKSPKTGGPIDSPKKYGH